MAGQQGHLAQLGHVPGADDDAAAVGVGFQLHDDFGNLVDVPAVGCGPAAPLHAVHRPQVAVGFCPLVPDGHTALLQPARVAVAAQEPQQLQHDGFQEHFLGGDQREALAQVEAHLVAEHALRASAGTVALVDAVLQHMAQ